MGFISFIQEAGQKLFGHKELAAAATEAAESADDDSAQSNLEEACNQASEAICNYIEQQNLGIEALVVTVDGPSSTVTVEGIAPTQEASEKVTLCCGNVAGVSGVNNLLSVASEEESSEDEAQYHDVVRGDTLSHIAKEYYGNANAYMKIFEANEPMLSHPDKIYPGQKLRIPA